LAKHDEFLMEIQDCLHQAQVHYNAVYDGKHQELSFQPGQWVWLRLVHWPLASMDVKGRSKLGPKFYGPFKIAAQVNDVAYRLELPPGTQLHDVFHVGLLKRFHGEPLESPGWLPPTRHGRACLVLATVMKSRLARGTIELLLTWKGRENADASWMEAMEFRQLYPSFQLEDELLVKGGGGKRCYDQAVLQKASGKEQSSTKIGDANSRPNFPARCPGCW
jgi:hypothetical protein